ncbi:hypothetical protein BPAE_0404g00060 [Botrytis paeoniae]|uniref:DDE-1 domain-containing protein n=1 Tax=Botrytis paeoniae TaxID=278948 RepID=A0A4Z1F0F7_9HELO|nr:hypothetical protein BPAE_0404g00060 [Botrytis paeoniae]
MTAIECINGNGRYLNPMIIWLASTHRSNWTTFPTPKWQYAYSNSGYTNSKISLKWLKRIFDPKTKERANKKPYVLIYNGFETYKTLEILEFCFENNILLYCFPSYISHKLQPYDIAVFASLKAAYRNQIDRLERGGVDIIGKEHFTSFYSLTREKAFMLKNIKAGFVANNLFPFNPDRVLRSMPAPPAELAMPRADEMKVGSCRQDIESQMPVTPVTPVTAEAFISILQEDRIQFLITINNEAKVRRSMRLLVLGKAKVMSYEDLEDARAKHAIKESTQAAKNKGKRGRKCKSGTPEIDEADVDTIRNIRKHKSVAQNPFESGNQVDRALVIASAVQISRIPTMEDEIVPRLLRALMIYMY